MDPATVMAGSTTWFPSAVVTVERCGPDDGDIGGWGREGGGVVPVVEEERDGAVLRRGDSVEAVGAASVWTWRRQIQRGIFWQPNGVQVKILRLVFKDKAARGFIGGSQ
jgi:hypothetical protein